MIEIESGPIVGEVVDSGSGIVAYRGIPYAAPPVGDLRWVEPQPVAPWDDVRPCTEFGPACPQSEAFFSDVLIQERPGISEDCLYLNVWCSEQSSKRPVMVWIHGGGFENGWGHQRDFDGAALARKGVVVVTINYRLGIFGFFAHPLLGSESAHGVSGNYGLLDQIAALTWVRNNISAFGGDPDCVTIFGESAGAMSVNLLRVSPLARGLFHRAICQSAPGGTEVGPPLKMLETVGERFAEKMLTESGDDDLAKLRAFDAASLLDETVNETSMKEVVSSGAQVSAFSFGPVMDEWVLPERREIQDVPVLLGINAEEGGYWAAMEDLFFVFESVENYESFIRWRARDHGDRLLEIYSAESNEDIRAAFTDYFTDTTFAKSTRDVAAAMHDINSNGYLYCFSRRNPRAPIDAAYHSIEIAYVFNNLPEDDGAADQRLAELLSSIWVQFATTGDPNGPSLPAWPIYDAVSDEYIDFDTTISVRSGLRKSTCDLL